MQDVKAQAGREALQLDLPVFNERGRDDDEVRRTHSLRLSFQEKGDHLHGLAQAHVVGQAAAETKLGEESEPLEAVRLIGAQLGREPGRERPRADAAGIVQLVEHAFQPLPGGNLNRQVLALEPGHVLVEQ